MTNKDQNAAHQLGQSPGDATRLDVANAVAAIMRATDQHIIDRTFIEKMTPYQYTTREVSKIIAQANKELLKELLTHINAFEEHRQEPDQTLKLVNQVIFKELARLEAEL